MNAQQMAPEAPWPQHGTAMTPITDLPIRIITIG
jgi:hypothetical protein